MPEAIWTRPADGPVITERMQKVLDRRAQKSSHTVKQESDPYSGPSSLFVTLPGTDITVEGEGIGDVVVSPAFSVEEGNIGDEDKDQGDTEDRIQDELASHLATENLDQEEEDKESDTLSNADSTVRNRAEEGAKPKDEVTTVKRTLRSTKKTVTLNEEVSGYESDGDEESWSTQRKSEKMRRYNKRNQLIKPGEVEVPGTKELSEEFCSFMINHKERKSGTAKAYAHPLFHRQDNKSLMSYLRGLNKNFQAGDLTNFEDDTGAYVLAPAPTDWVYTVLPSHNLFFSSQQ